ncbi:hypothetical protein HGA13_24655 [Nocardia speluncae]|uniref:Uncharacterized protein n=1 Tax=Nocardia speluncae TaxID=419477 RepID=A0A846XLM8_9NOCA|nr:hypothetical protein [Nocardia speluncae]NKY36235.1 hypothetical protein [Nocardia speluncae]
MEIDDADSRYEWQEPAPYRYQSRTVELRGRGRNSGRPRLCSDGCRSAAGADTGHADPAACSHCHARAADYDARAADYDARAADYDARAADYDARAADYDARAADYDARAADHDARAADHDARAAAATRRLPQRNTRARPTLCRTRSGRALRCRRLRRLRL